MKALTFLGPSNYAFTKYSYKGKTAPTRFFAEALPHFFPEIEQILVFVTPTVQKHSNLEEIQSRLGDILQPIPIPESHTEDALWAIFDALVENVQPGEKVIFDITNSFRSIPFLVFIAAAFLRAARKVKVEAVIYGAYEARDADNVSPVFDLTPFISMFDWLSATNQFIYTGNARYLSEQLYNQPGVSLDALAENVEQIAMGLELLRPRDVAQAAAELPTHLTSVEDVLPKPFGVIVRSLETDYSRFGVPPEHADDWAYLRSQLKMIDWYANKQHYVHALSMAREWLVSLVCLEFGLDMWDKKQREESEFLLSSSGIWKNQTTGEVEKQSPYREQWMQFPHRKQIARLWQGRERGAHGQELNLANLRNDVLHSGFRKNPKGVDAIVAQVQRIIAELHAIAQNWEQLQQ